VAHVPEVEAKPWGAFLPWFAGVWKPGEHIGVVAPTGAGKTTFIGGVIQYCRKYALAFDPKGGDTTLKGMGWPRLPTWPPPPQVYKDIEDGKLARYIVGPGVASVADLPRQRAIFQQALQGAFDNGGWTIYVDELQLLADRRMMGLGTDVERLLIAARDKGISVVSAYQRPANVPRTASDQATWMAVSFTRDKDVVDRVAEMLGRPKPEIRGALNGLDPYSWVVVGRDPRMPLIITRPKEIARRTVDAVQ
jgi:DNA helicase HerA-like ATPase